MTTLFCGVTLDTIEHIFAGIPEKRQHEYFNSILNVWGRAAVEILNIGSDEVGSRYFRFSL